MKLDHAIRKAFFLGGVEPDPPKKVRLTVVPEQAPKTLREMLPIKAGKAPKISLQTLIDQYLFTLNKKDEPKTEISFPWGGTRKRGVVSPSSLCKEDVCERMLVYDLLQAPMDKQVDAKMRRIFDNGHFFHARMQHTIQNAIERVGGKFYREVPVGEAPCKGTTDGGFVLSGYSYLIELKSMNDSKFKELGRSPWPEHKSQLNIYQGLSGVHQGIILVENKNNQELREFYTEFDKDDWDRTSKITTKVDQAAKAKKLPLKITEKEGCQGEWCGYYALCKGGKQGTWNP